jgi:hypothetical protein
MSFSPEISRSIDLIAAQVAKDYDLDQAEFLFPEGDGLETRIEALILSVWEQVEEAVEMYDTSKCSEDALED